MSLKQKIPPASSRPRDCNDPGERPVIAFEGYEVVEWSPGRIGEAIPPTEVHLLIPVPGLQFGLRLKSARALDELVGSLLRHRQGVWGPK